MTRIRAGVLVAPAVAMILAGCGDKTVADPPSAFVTSCPGVNFGPTPAQLTLQQKAPATMQTLGAGSVTARYTAEIAVRGNTAYTTSWNGGPSRAVGNALYVWDVSGDIPVLADTVIVTGGVLTLGDVAVSPDGTLLVVATELSPGSIVVFDLTDPRHPAQLSRFNSPETQNGVHTAEIGVVNGKLYAFLAIDLNGSPSRVTIVDLSVPAAPRQVFSKVAGNPFSHDSFERDGLLFVGLWNNGTEIWDIGGCAAGGTPESPHVLGGIKTVGGKTHNIWWYHDQNGSKGYAFVGEEGFGDGSTTSSGDIHVVDLTVPTAPSEVAFYHVDGAGTHNFSIDESNGILYAAFYNGGVRALDVRGDLSKCTAAQQATAGGVTRCDLRLMGRELAVGLLDQGKPVYVWGVQYLNGTVYASDMRNGIWKLRAISR